MKKLTVGLPRGLYYYYYSYLLKDFFNELNINLLTSPKTNKEIVDRGIEHSSDEMCLSLKLFFGHLKKLENKCDYIIIMRLDNFGKNDKMCTNYTSIYELSKYSTESKLINLNIDLENYETLEYSLLKNKKYFKKSSFQIKKALKNANDKDQKRKRNLCRNNINKLNSEKIKILIVSHPYIIYDEYFGAPLTDFLKKLNIEIIYSNLFDEEITATLSKRYSEDLYWKFEKEKIGSIKLTENHIDGIIFISAFPCGPDSLVNELVIRKLSKPYLQLNIDDMSGFAGIETRLESFVDILEQR